jgi:hypothetical protein
MTNKIPELLAHATVTEAIYTPAELEQISGLTTDMQRVWRRRGQIPSQGSGHARFTIHEVIEITIRYVLSKIGIPPSEIRLDLAKAIIATKAFAVFNYGGCEVVGPADEVDNFLREFSDDNGELGIYLAGSPKELHYLVLNEWHETRIVDDPAKLVPDTEEFLMVFNLALFGNRLTDRGGKPVVTVRFPDRPGQRTVRRITGVGTNDS